MSTKMGSIGYRPMAVDQVGIGGGRLGLQFTPFSEGYAQLDREQVKRFHRALGEWITATAMVDGYGASISDDEIDYIRGILSGKE